MSEWTGFRGSQKDKEFPAITAYFDESGHSASIEKLRYMHRNPVKRGLVESAGVLALEQLP
jgi:hypothetical protein